MTCSTADIRLLQMAPKNQPLTTAFPTFSPRSIPINAFGMFSNPSVTVSRYTSFPYNQTAVYHTMFPQPFQKQ
jgi:hypothetical protein